MSNTVESSSDFVAWEHGSLEVPLNCDLSAELRKEFSDPGDVVMNGFMAAGLLARWSPRSPYSFQAPQTLKGIPISRGRLQFLANLSAASASTLDIFSPEQYIWQRLVEAEDLPPSDELADMLQKVLSFEVDFETTDGPHMLWPEDYALLHFFDARIREMADDAFRGFMDNYFQQGSYLPFKRFDIEIGYYLTDPAYQAAFFENELERIHRPRSHHHNEGWTIWPPVQTEHSLNEDEKEQKIIELGRFREWTQEQHEGFKELLLIRRPV